MPEKKWTRFLKWVCTKIGHKTEGEGWVFNGKLHNPCERCNFIISTKVEKGD